MSVVRVDHRYCEYQHFSYYARRQPAIWHKLNRMILAVAIVLLTAGMVQAINIDILSGGPADLTWQGNLSGDWDLIKTKNWLNGTAADYFYSADRVTFDDTAYTTLINLPANVMPGSVTINNASINYAFQGPGEITGGTGLTKLGSGTLVLTNNNTYSGTTTINNGKLTLGADNALPSGSPMILGGGKLATGIFSQTNSLGPLTLGSSSIIDMGALGSSTLKFADSHLMSWSGLLTVTNWNGSFAGGGPDELFFGSLDSSLTLGQLSDIIFTNPNSLIGDYQTRILATGEIVPVPEPGSIILFISGAIAGLIWWRRRR